MYYYNNNYDVLYYTRNLQILTPYTLLYLLDYSLKFLEHNLNPLAIP